jgi:hypothetical protein
MKRSLAATCVLAALFGFGCTTGQGEGSIKSDRLFVQDCWNGPFDLDPQFFGANPFRDEAILIRIQNDDDIEEMSDGVTIVIDDPPKIRGETGESMLGQDIRVGLPPGVSPPGIPIVAQAEPPLVSMALYLHDTCHIQIGTLYALSGTIRFDSLFSGDINEDVADDRLTEGSFSATFADPRDLVASDVPGEPAAVPAERSSEVTGAFRFFFQRGQPAQPFP